MPKHVSGTSFHQINTSTYVNSNVYVIGKSYSTVPPSFQQCRSICLLSDIVAKAYSKNITVDEIRLHSMIEEHHHLFKAAYGLWKVTINHHMMLHLSDVLLQFGPIHGFWCFAYEHMNGFLQGEKYSTSIA